MFVDPCLGLLILIDPSKAVRMSRVAEGAWSEGGKESNRVKSSLFMILA